MKSKYIFLLMAVFALLSSSVAIGQESNVAEPEYIGVVYHLDSTGKMGALDRQRFRYKAGLKGLVFGGAKLTADLEGKSAALRVPSNEKMSFVVQLPYGSDPRKIQLFSFEVKDGNRQLVITSGSVFKGQTLTLPIQLNITRFGQNSYKLTPTDVLAVGEYAFIAENSVDLFCFGVDKKD